MRQVNESGRSMLEMIAVIVLMLLLLLVGLWGFKNASLSARMNTLNKDIATAVAQRRYQIAQSGTQKPHTLSGKVGSTEMTIENIVSAEKQGEFVIILKNQSQEVCEGLKKFNIFHVKNFKINGKEDDPCVKENDIVLYFSGSSDDNGDGGNPLGGHCDNVSYTTTCCATTRDSQGCLTNKQTACGDGGICKADCTCDTCPKGESFDLDNMDCYEQIAGLPAGCPVAYQKKVDGDIDECHKCVNGVKQVKTNSLCGECGKCNARGTCESKKQTLTTAKYVGNCCRARGASYCPLNETLGTACTTNKYSAEQMEKSHDGCQVERYKMDLCTNTKVSVNRSNTPQGQACEGTCGRCNGTGACVPEALKTVNVLNGNCCDGSQTQTYCPVSESVPAACTGNKTETTITGTGCGQITTTKDLCTNTILSTTNNNEGRSCGECGTCQGGVCQNEMKRKTYTYKKMVEGVCKVVSEELCPYEDHSDQCQTKECQNCNACQKCNTETGECEAIDSTKTILCGTGCCSATQQCGKNNVCKDNCKTQPKKWCDVRTDTFYTNGCPNIQKFDCPLETPVCSAHTHCCPNDKPYWNGTECACDPETTPDGADPTTCQCNKGYAETTTIDGRKFCAPLCRAGQETGIILMVDRSGSTADNGTKKKIENAIEHLAIPEDTPIAVYFDTSPRKKYTEELIGGQMRYIVKKGLNYGKHSASQIKSSITSQAIRRGKTGGDGTSFNTAMYDVKENICRSGRKLLILFWTDGELNQKDDYSQEAKNYFTNLSAIRRECHSGSALYAMRPNKHPVPYGEEKGYPFDKKGKSENQEQMNEDIYNYVRSNYCVK